MKDISVFFLIPKNVFRYCMLKLLTNVLILRIRLSICSTKWMENYDVVFVIKKFYPAVVGSLDHLSESRHGEVLERAMPYLKVITTPRFLVSLEVIKATLKLTKTVAKKLQGIKKLF